MAGFIPVDQFYSKLCGQKHKTELMNRKVAECLRDGHAIADNLQITGSRINELVHMGLLTRHQPDKTDLSHSKASRLMVICIYSPRNRLKMIYMLSMCRKMIHRYVFSVPRS